MFLRGDYASGDIRYRRLVAKPRCLGQSGQDGIASSVVDDNLEVGQPAVAERRLNEERFATLRVGPPPVFNLLVDVRRPDFPVSLLQLCEILRKSFRE